MPAEEKPRFEIVGEHEPRRLELFVNDVLIFRGPGHVTLRLAAKALENPENRVSTIPVEE